AEETRARGEEVRVDDTAEVLVKRLATYRAQTEPLIHYYSEKRKLLTVDGMMTIEEVTREISRILHAVGAVEIKPPKKAGSAKRAAGKPAPKATKSAARTRPAAKKLAKTARKAVKRPSGAAKKAVKKAPARAPKKVTKKRAKA